MTAYERIKSEVKSFHRTDTGNAEMFARLYGVKVRYDHKRGRWLVWNTHRWVDDNQKSIKSLAMEMAKQIQQDALLIDDTKLRLVAVRWGTQSESKVRIDAFLDLAKSIPPLSDNGLDWDANPWVLSCPNGIIDLKTGILQGGKPEDKISMTTNVEYEDQECPRWKQFLSEVFLNDQILIKFVQKSLGYSITGSVREQVCFFCYGNGANGKSVLFKTISSILGDYAHDAPTSLFQRNFNSTSTNDVAQTEGKRFLVSAETLSTAKLNEQRIKSWTGGDRVTARYLYQEHFTFEPTVKPWLFVNHKPQIDDDSHGFWRRVRLIPFERTFAQEEQDHDLINKLKVESAGILRWLIHGCLMWQTEGLSPIPEQVKMATETYQMENDVLAEFIYSKCELIEFEETKARALYQAYEDWATVERLNKDDKLTSTAFGRKLSEKFKKIAKKDGTYYQGLRIAGGELSEKNERGGELTPHFTKSPIREESKSILRNWTPNPPPSLKTTPQTHHQTDESGQKVVENMTLSEITNLFE